MDIFEWLSKHLNAKYQPIYWCELLNVRIIDDDGWRERDSKSFSEPIGLTEFMERLNRSTTEAPRPKKGPKPRYLY